MPQLIPDFVTERKVRSLSRSANFAVSSCPNSDRMRDINTLRSFFVIS